MDYDELNRLKDRLRAKLLHDRDARAREPRLVMLHNVITEIEEIQKELVETMQRLVALHDLKRRLS